MEKLDKLRKKIDSIDNKIALLLKERHKIVKEIGSIKEKHGLPIYNKNREEELLNNVLEKTNNGNVKGYLESIFSYIFKISRKIQKK